MKKTLVIGAHGKIGQRLVALMVKQGMPVVAMIRDAAQKIEMEESGVETIVADLEQPLADELFKDIDKIVFSAGSGANTGADKTLLVDLWGACKLNRAVLLI